ncbi:filamentous hemagglutinin family outer membrane protein [Stanieria cyanosphaera PCC 7437]|uniref:Filamentous hemagglutinin family outer membrane protein n=1 Tax=Stanieria cyanosphaera (strain ATCC 29371 / PCC 7437) TaxID=111780 RepID=K9XTK0_STAC7|nr:filamentous hemagglutinin N-terminal domain-containing protein [Stanieria cyanosphaera]AFZ35389.1 filamentous hemagglutinin family outer membrane protein [Stanieria cyanosphaera PCC 7437]
MSIQKLYKFWLRTSLALTSFYCLTGTDLAQAQSITPDATLPTPTEVTPTATGVEITGGTARDINLFHSFQEFSLLNGNEAFFNNASTISNIITRVTGGQISTIDGLIRANNANLFFLNPAGILFGPNASLNIGGSFYGSTADSLIFPEGEFSATNPQAPPILTINAPIGLGFRDNPGEINVNGSSLSVDTGETLALLGGNVNAEGGIIAAPGGRIELGGLSTEGTVNISEDSGFTFSDGIARADVSLSNDALVNVANQGGGFINVNAGNLNLSERSQFRGGIAAGLDATGNPAGNININATGAITLSGDSSVQNFIDEDAIGNSGDINVTADSLSLIEESSFDASIFGTGNAGAVNIQANDILLDNSTIFNQVTSTGNGNGGGVEIDTANLFLINGGAVTATTFGKGDAGIITINADDTILIDGRTPDGEFISTIENNVRQGAEGDGGSIEIVANKLFIANEAEIDSSTKGQGNAGVVNIQANDILLDNGGIFNQVAEGGEGNGGGVEIGTTNLSLINGGIISASTFGQGNAGAVNVQANDILLDNGGIFNRVAEGAVGNGGGVEIKTTNLSLINGGIISASTFGQGDAGVVNIQANDILLDNGEILNRVEENAVGNGGGVEIGTTNLSLTNGGRISASTFGQGNAGAVNIQANDILLDNSTIFNQVISTAKGNGGGVEIGTTNLSLTNGGRISASTFGQGDAGEVNVQANDILLDDGGIFNRVAEGAVGNGGGVEIKTTNLSLINDGEIDASTSGQGDAGVITINAIDTISISNSSIFNGVETGAIGNAGGIDITTVNLNLTNGGEIDASTFGQGDAGAVNIQANDILLNNGRILNRVEENAIGNGGGVEIGTTNLSLINGGRIDASTLGKGDAGAITIQANDILLDSSTIFNQVTSTGNGNGGGVEIDTTNLFLINGGAVTATTFGKGDAGIITINADDTILIDGRTPDGKFISTIENNVRQGAEGDGGSIEIVANKLFIANEAEIDSSTKGQGNAGVVNIQANDILLDNGGILNQVDEGGEGNGGGVEIGTTNLSLINGGRISASTFGQGNAGLITINDSDTIFIDGENSQGDSSGIFNGVGTNAVGDAGGINITTANLNLTNGGVVNASTFERGNAGLITINASDTIFIDGENSQGDSSGIFNGVDTDAVGNAGGINITTANLNLTNGGVINVSSFGQGNAGSIVVEANSLTLDAGKIFAANAPSQPITNNQTGGNIKLTVADNLILRNNSLISASASENATGGNVTIDAGFVVAFPSNENGNDIVANAVQGQGGQVTINAQQIFNLEERKAEPGNGTNDIDVSSEGGLAGQVNITIFKDDVLRNASELPRNPVEPEQTVAQACSSQGIAEGGNSFTVTGKGGVPPVPTEPMSSDTILLGSGEAPVQGSRGAEESLSTNSSHHQNQQPKGILTSQGYIVPAQGIVKTEDGKVMLVGYPVNNLNQRTPVQSPNCVDTPRNKLTRILGSLTELTTNNFRS